MAAPPSGIVQTDSTALDARPLSSPRAAEASPPVLGPSHPARRNGVGRCPRRRHRPYAGPPSSLAQPMVHRVLGRASASTKNSATFVVEFTRRPVRRQIAHDRDPDEGLLGPGVDQAALRSDVDQLADRLLLRLLTESLRHRLREASEHLVVARQNRTPWADAAVASSAESGSLDTGRARISAGIFRSALDHSASKGPAFTRESPLLNRSVICGLNTSATTIKAKGRARLSTSEATNSQDVRRVRLVAGGVPKARSSAPSLTAHVNRDPQESADVRPWRRPPCDGCSYPRQGRGRASRCWGSACD